MVEIRAANRSAQSFDIGLLPPALWRGLNLLDLPRLETGPQGGPEGPVPNPKEVRGPSALPDALIPRVSPLATSTDTGTGTVRVTTGWHVVRVLLPQPFARLVLRPSDTVRRSELVAVRGPPMAEQRQQHLVGDSGTLECAELGYSERGTHERLLDVVHLDQLDQHGLANAIP